MADPGAGSANEAGLEGISFRRPTEVDYPSLVRIIDDWWGGRSMDFLLPRLWLQHFTSTSWLAETADGGLAGFLIGFHSPDQQNVAYCRLIGTNPNLRRRGLGRALYERFFDDARRAGRHEVRAITWPGNRQSVAFHRAIGFEVVGGPGTQNLYGVPAFAGYDFEREDRAVLVRSL
jgi:L-amino acid N-acyltransferase YncA